MKLHSALFLLALVFISTNLLSMKDSSKKISKKSLKGTLKELRESFNNNESVLSHNTGNAVQRIIESATKELSKKIVKKKKLKMINQEIQAGIEILNKAFKQNEIEQHLLEIAAQIKLSQEIATRKPKRPQMQQLPSEQRLSIKIEEFITPLKSLKPIQKQQADTAVNFLLSPQETPEISKSSLIPIKNVTSSDQSQNQINEWASLTHIYTPPLQPPLITAQKFSNNLEALKISNTQPSWKRIIGYFSVAGLSTVIGLYSYYKLPSEQWYRPVFIGLSNLSAVTCSYLAYREWRMPKIIK